MPIILVPTGTLLLAVVLLYRKSRFATSEASTTPVLSVLVVTRRGFGPGGGAVSEAADTEPRRPDEFERVLSHREQMFRTLGFNLWQSASLAEAGADWHEAEKLLERTCPHETVLDLLLP